MLPLLSDDDPDIRQNTLWSLGQIKAAGRHAKCIAEHVNRDDGDDEWSRYFAIEALGDENAEFRQIAVWALGKFGEKAAAHSKRIAEMVKDSDPNVREKAVEALGAIGESATAFIPDIEAMIRDEADPLIRKRAETTLEKLLMSK